MNKSYAMTVPVLITLVGCQQVLGLDELGFDTPQDSGAESLTGESAQDAATGADGEPDAGTSAGGAPESSSPSSTTAADGAVPSGAANAAEGSMDGEQGTPSMDMLQPPGAESDEQQLPTTEATDAAEPGAEMDDSGEQSDADMPDSGAVAESEPEFGSSQSDGGVPEEAEPEPDVGAEPDASTDLPVDEVDATVPEPEPPAPEGGATEPEPEPVETDEEEVPEEEAGVSEPPPPEAGTDPPTCTLRVTELSEDFSDAERFEEELEQGCWGVFNEADIAFRVVDEDDSVLRLQPHDGGGWYQTSTGALYYREVEGNFVAETTVEVAHTYQPDALPDAQWSGGALLVYDSTRQLDVDDVYYLMGSGTLLSSDYGVKSEVTVNGTTYQQLDPEMTGSNRLRVCRVGVSLYTLYAPIGSDEWQVFAYQSGSAPLPPLPQIVYVGLSAYQYQAGPETTEVEFDGLRISTNVDSFDDCDMAL